MLDKCQTNKHQRSKTRATEAMYVSIYVHIAKIAACVFFYRSRGQSALKSTSYLRHSCMSEYMHMYMAAAFAMLMLFFFLLGVEKRTRILLGL